MANSWTTSFSRDFFLGETMIDEAFLIPGPEDACHITVKYHNDEVFDRFFMSSHNALLEHYGTRLRHGGSFMILRRTTHVQRWRRGVRRFSSQTPSEPVIPPKPAFLRGIPLPELSHQIQPTMILVRSPVLFLE